MAVAGGSDRDYGRSGGYEGSFREREQADYGPSKGGQGFGGGGGGIGGADISGGKTSGGDIGSQYGGAFAGFGNTSTTTSHPGSVFSGVGTSTTYDPYKTASKGMVGQLTQNALDIGRTTGVWNAPTGPQVAAALSWDVGIQNLGYDPYALNPPKVTPMTILVGLQTLLSSVGTFGLGMFRTAALGGLGPITGKGVKADMGVGARQAEGSGNRASYADFGTQPGAPSGGTAGGTNLGGGYHTTSGGVVPNYRNTGDLSGFPQEAPPAPKKPFPWWLLILAALAIGGYFVYRYYKKKRT